MRFLGVFLGTNAQTNDIYKTFRHFFCIVMLISKINNYTFVSQKHRNNGTEHIFYACIITR